MRDKPKSKSALECEAYEASIIAEAVHWTAFQFCGVGARYKHEAKTRAEAEAAAQVFLAKNSRPVMIYAVNAAGRQALAGSISKRK